jgi:hypothetical protein
MEIAMTPASQLRSGNSGPINGEWPVFGNLTAESLHPSTRPVCLHPKAAPARRLAVCLRRLLNWWTRPVPAGSGRSATDAATRLEILTRGGFPR